MDATLLETEYDVVIVGTGMTEAILAGALARVGKKVLHLDQNDYYGSNYASFHFDQFLRWSQNQASEPREHENIQRQKTNVLNDFKFGLESNFQCYLVEETFHSSLSMETKEILKTQSNQFSIDINPRLVLSSEEIVQILITSGVGRYLEFAAIERTYIHVDETTLDNDMIWEVPCSKKDVFASKLLGMVEKRMLMKFLQFVADYGETHIRGEDVNSKNERELSLGRSLKRPQNKQNQVGTHSDIENYMEQPFHSLLTEYFKLSDKLQQVVIYCVALATFPQGTSHVESMNGREGLAAVYRYVASIGRFTGNAFLVPLYGVSEITQSFCRLCAVYGGIYVLRAPITSFVVSENKISGIECTDGGVIRAKQVIVNASYLHNFNSSHSRPSQVVRGVFLLSSSLRNNMNRFMIVIPPNDPQIKNPFVVHIIQLDHGAYVCPENYFLVQVTMVLPVSWYGEKSKQRLLMHAIITRLIHSAMAEKNEPINEITGDEELVWNDRIVWRAIYAMDHYLVQYSNATKEAPYTSPTDSLPSNLWICETSSDKEMGLNPLEIHLEGACVNAKAIFEQMCPGEAFLPKSASAEQAEQEELEDEQEAVLKAAKKLAEKTDQPIEVSQDEGNVV